MEGACQEFAAREPSSWYLSELFCSTSASAGEHRPVIGCTSKQIPGRGLSRSHRPRTSGDLLLAEAMIRRHPRQVNAPELEKGKEQNERAYLSNMANLLLCQGLPKDGHKANRKCCCRPDFRLFLKLEFVGRKLKLHCHPAGTPCSQGCAQQQICS